MEPEQKKTPEHVRREQKKYALLLVLLCLIGLIYAITVMRLRHLG